MKNEEEFVRSEEEFDTTSESFTASINANSKNRASRARRNVLPDEKILWEGVADCNNNNNNNKNRTAIMIGIIFVISGIYLIKTCNNDDALGRIIGCVFLFQGIKTIFFTKSETQENEQYVITDKRVVMYLCGEYTMSFDTPSIVDIKYGKENDDYAVVIFTYYPVKMKEDADESYVSESWTLKRTPNIDEAFTILETVLEQNKRTKHYNEDAKIYESPF